MQIENIIRRIRFKYFISAFWNCVRCTTYNPYDEFKARAVIWKMGSAGEENAVKQTKCG